MGSPTGAMQFYSGVIIASIRELGLEEQLGRAGRGIAELAVARAEEHERAERELGGLPDRPHELREEDGGEARILIADLGDLEGAAFSANQAFLIHATHQDLLDLKEKVLEIINDNIEDADSSEDKIFFNRQLDALKDYPAFAEDN